MTNTLNITNSKGQNVSYPVVWYKSDDQNMTGERDLITNIAIYVNGNYVKLNYFGLGKVSVGAAAKEALGQSYANVASAVWNGHGMYSRFVKELETAPGKVNILAHTLQGMVVVAYAKNITDKFVEAHNKGVKEGYYNSSDQDIKNLYFTGKIHKRDIVSS